MDVGVRGSELCPVVGFSISGVGTSICAHTHTHARALIIFTAKFYFRRVCWPHWSAQIRFDLCCSAWFEV